MKRSEINQFIKAATACFSKHGWTLPPNPRWDVTDFGLGDFSRYGLLLVNLAEEAEYCEKLMYATRKMTTPAHTHAKKKEDIICRFGRLAIQVWSAAPHLNPIEPTELKFCGESRPAQSGDIYILNAGERVTLIPGVYHAFYPESDECIIGEVSTANDDAHDNFFDDPKVGRFSAIEEDEYAIARLISEKDILS